MKTWRSSWGYKFGVGFWTGAGVYSLVNLFLNYRQIVQNKILNYDFIIFLVALFGLVLNLILLTRNKN
ncbi:Uncharacterised protein [uncultured archaeon]|nr:Uncharacterised protein [uncultured archaeon]